MRYYVGTPMRRFATPLNTQADPSTLHVMHNCSFLNPTTTHALLPSTPRVLKPTFVNLDFSPRDTKLRTSYQCFRSRCFRAMRDSPLTLTEKHQHIGEAWRRMSLTERQIYEWQAMSECQNVLRKLNKTERAKLNVPKIVEKHLSAYNLFLQDRLVSRKRTHTSDKDALLDNRDKPQEGCKDKINLDDQLDLTSNGFAEETSTTYPTTLDQSVFNERLKTAAEEWRAGRFIQLYQSKLHTILVGNASQQFDRAKFKRNEWTVQPPKRFTPAFFLFCSEQFQQAKDRGECVSFRTRSQQNIERWRSMTNDERQPYVEREQTERNTFQKQKQEYEEKATLTDRLIQLKLKLQKQQLRFRRVHANSKAMIECFQRRKHPPSAYNLFVRAQFKDMRSRDASLKLGHVMPDLGRMWQSLSAVERESWADHGSSSSSRVDTTTQAEASNSKEKATRDIVNKLLV